MRPHAALLALFLLAACAGYEKGSDMGWGFDALDTQTKEGKANEKWWNSFYGSHHCVWGDDCLAEEEKAGGGGGMWHSGIGSSDSGSSGSGSGSSDSGSSN